MPVSPDLETDELKSRKTLSLRLSQTLYESLAATKAEGQSMNEVICDAIASFVERPDLAPSNLPSDINNQIARDALRMGTEAIPPLKGIANYCSKREQWSLACVLYVAAARLVQVQQGSDAAAAELKHTANLAWANNRKELAIALWTEVLELDPDQLEAANRLGQELHHLASQRGDDIETYRQAERYLKPVVYDNRARLFHGWSTYFVELADSHSDSADRALEQVVESLKSWAFGSRKAEDRKSWLYQVQRLARVDRERARKLVEFANRNANWAPVSYEAEVAIDSTGPEWTDDQTIPGT